MTEDGWLAGRLDGERYRVLADGRATGGLYAAVEIVALPGGRAPLHRHAAEGELFHVRSGTLAVVVDGVERTLGPGDSALVPRATPHAFATVGDAPVHLVAIYTPAGPEGWFRDVFRPLGEGASSSLEDVLARMRTAGARHGIEWLE